MLKKDTRKLYPNGRPPRRKASERDSASCKTERGKKLVWGKNDDKKTEAYERDSGGRTLLGKEPRRREPRGRESPGMEPGGKELYGREPGGREPR